MKRIGFFLLAATLLSTSCDDLIKDEEAPVIDMSAVDAFPVNCAEVKRGESFTFRAVFTDNQELGSYSITLHHNFDHHTHSTSATECEMDPIKKAVNPFLKVSEYSIAPGSTRSVATVEIQLPPDIDTGDYHFMVRLTDQAGWQSFKGISIKIVE